MNRILFLLITLLPLSGVISKTCDTTARIQLIQYLSAYIKDSLALRVGDDFYSKTSDSAGMFVYLYVSEKKRIKKVSKGPFIFFGTRYEEARQEAERFSRAGFDTMIYRTAGTSSALLSKRLLEYDSLSIAFIVFHEAMHRHSSRVKSGIAYDDDEALADLAGNYFVTLLFDSAGHFRRNHENIYIAINDCIRGKISASVCRVRIQNQLINATLFQKDRYDYEVNNAFLLRNLYYTRQYFRLKKRLGKQKDGISFFRSVMKRV